MTKTSKNTKNVSSKKRRYRDRGGGGGGVRAGGGSGSGATNNHRVRMLNNPKRGAPGILMTCEQGKERVCQREGLEIIQHYYSRMVERTNKEGDDANHIGDDGLKQTKRPPQESSSTPLTLEEELNQLQSSNNDPQSDSNFGIFETGCRGIVFALCAVTGSEMIPSVKAQKKNYQQQPDPQPNDAPNDETSDQATNEPETKKQRTIEKESSPPTSSSSNRPQEALRSETAILAATATTTTTPLGNPQWDPVPIVRQILQDAKNDSAKEAPSSRFVTRMIPIQVTCYASEEELRIASSSLIRHYLPPSTTTFAVAVKRRFCPGHLTKEKIITTVAAEVQNVVPKIKVSLDNPEVTVVVEICKTLCGISVIPRCNEHFRNFNLVVARDHEHSDQER